MSHENLPIVVSGPRELFTFTYTLNFSSASHKNQNHLVKDEVTSPLQIQNRGRHVV
jgi:hypothetical protein